MRFILLDSGISFELKKNMEELNNWSYFRIKPSP